MVGALSRTVGVRLALLVALAIGSGACNRGDGGGQPTGAEPSPDSRPTASASPSPSGRPLPGSFSEALDEYVGTRHGSVEAAVDAWEDYAGILAAEMIENGHAESTRSAISTAVGRLVSTREGAETLFHNEQLLDGQELVLPRPTRPMAAPAPQLNGRPIKLAASSEPVKVYFINGVLNTSLEAAETAVQLEAVFGTKVHLIYNHSYLEPSDYTVSMCMRGIVEKYRSGPGVADAGEGSWAKFVAEVSRLVDSGVDAGLTAACAGVDGVLTGANYYQVGDLLNSGMEQLGQRFADGAQQSSQVNERLLKLLKNDIRSGRRVILTAHSQGTMFARRAYEDIQRWYQLERELGNIDSFCGDKGRSSDPSKEIAPLGAVYLSPAFGSGTERGADTGKQGYVMMSGDVLNKGQRPTGWSIGDVPSNVEPTDEQDYSWFAPWGAIGAHMLSTYLLHGTPSRALIEQTFGSVRQAVQDVECPEVVATPTPAPEVTPTPEDGLGLVVVGEEKWVVYAVVVGPGQSDWMIISSPESYADDARPKRLMLKGEFGSRDEAAAAACDNLSDVRVWPLGTGLHGKWSDGNFYALEFGCP
jgi:hypothetical protein